MGVVKYFKDVKSGSTPTLADLYSHLGAYRMENGSDWIFPAAGFSGRGVVQGIGVRCLSPETQVLCHAHGYVPTEKDLRDMELLQARFGVELPPHLRRNEV